MTATLCATFIAVTAQAADKKRYLKLLTILSIGFLSWLPGNVQPLRADEPNPVTAIDICLEPDATMVQHAEAVNARLRGVFAKGFALDASHRPHIMLVQRFVGTADLDQVYAAAGKAIANNNVANLKLEAFKYYYIPDKELGLSGIVIKPTPELLKVEQDVIDAVAPFSVKTGTSAAFVRSEDPGVNALPIKYVEVFVPEHSGEHLPANE